MYQEDFLLLGGEALSIVEAMSAQLRAWDFVHCPPGTGHMIVGAGTGRASCVPSARAIAPPASTGAAVGVTRPPG
jgi:hypothetical protein